MVYKRYIKRNGKLCGPYYYESYRDKNGKIISKYLKDYKPPKKYNKININLFIFIIGIVIISFLFLLYLGNLNYYYKYSIIPVKFTGKAIENIGATSEDVIIAEQIADNQISSDVDIRKEVNYKINNRNRITEFDTPDGKITISFNLLNYSEFVEASSLSLDNEASINSANVFIEPERFNTTFNESSEKYKWSYSIKLMDLNFMAKVDISSESGIIIINNQTLKIGDNYISFSDLTNQGYIVRVENPVLINETINEIINQTEQKTETNISEINITNPVENISIINETEIIINQTETNETLNNTGTEPNKTGQNEQLENNTETSSQTNDKINNTETNSGITTNIYEDTNVVDNTETENQDIINEPISEPVGNIISENSESESSITGFFIRSFKGLTFFVIGELEKVNTVSIYIQRDFRNTSPDFNETLVEDNKSIDDENDFIRASVSGIISGAVVSSFDDLNNDGIASLNDIINLDPSLIVIEGGTATDGNIIYQCGSITSEGVYNMNQSIVATSACITISSSNVEINCNGFGISSNLANYGIYSTGFNNITVRNCNISMNSSSWGSFGIYLENTKDSLIVNNTASHNNVGISVVGLYSGRMSSNVSVVNNTANYNYNYGIYFWYVNNSVIDNCNTSFNSNNSIGWGFLISQYSFGNIIKNSFSDRNFYAGAEITSYSYNNTIFNLTARGNSGYFGTQYGDGIILTVFSHDNFIYNNTIANSDRCGLVLTGGTTSTGPLNNIFTNNWVNNSLLAGICMSFSTSGNVFYNTTIPYSRGIGIRLNNVSGNQVVGGVVNNSQQDAIALLNTDNYNNFSDILISRTKSTYKDFNSASAVSVGEVYIINTLIAKYNLLSSGSLMKFKNSSFGEIAFSSGINGSGNVLFGNSSADIKIENNSVYVNSSKSGLNKSAIVSIYNTPNLINPVIIYNGNQYCGPSTSYPRCINLTSLNSGNVSFSVRTWSNYSLMEDLQQRINFAFPTDESPVRKFSLIASVEARIPNFSNLTVYLYNSTGSLIQSNFTTSNNISINFRNLSIDTYSINASASNSSNNFISTETRSIQVIGTIVLSCQDLDSAGETYTLNNSIDNANESCINITAPNIVFDCNGFYISGNNFNGLNPGDPNGIYFPGIGSVFGGGVGLLVLSDGFLSLNGYSANPSNEPVSPAAVFSNQLNITIKNCNISMKPFGYGIKLVNTSNNYIFNNTFNSQYVGLYLNNVSYSRIEKNLFENNTYNGVDLRYYSINNNLSDNVFIKSRFMSMFFSTGTRIVNTVLSNCSGSKACQYLVNGSNAGVYCFGGYNSCIYLLNSNASCLNCSYSSESLDGLSNDYVVNPAFPTGLVIMTSGMGSSYAPTPFNFIRSWYYQAHVIENNTLSNIENASVFAYNSFGDLTMNITTNQSGWTPIFELVDYYNFGGSGKNYQSNYIMAANGNMTLWDSHLYNITQTTNNLNDSFIVKEDLIPPNQSGTEWTSTTNEVIISWTTDEGSNSSVTYWASPSVTIADNKFVINHVVNLTGLSSNTTYNYYYSSCDFAGNCISSNNYTFKTSELGKISGSSGGGLYCIPNIKCSLCSGDPGKQGTRTCRDDNSCPQSRTYTESCIVPLIKTRDVKTQEELPSLIGGRNCVPDFDCMDWGDCRANYNVEDLINQRVLLKGVQERVCVDENKCTYNKIEKQECSVKIPVISKKVCRCFKCYIEVYEMASSLSSNNDNPKGYQILDSYESFDNETSTNATKVGNLIARLEILNETYAGLNVQMVLDDYGYCPYCYNGIKDYDESGIDCVAENNGNCPVCMKESPKSKNYWIFIIIILLVILFIILSSSKKSRTYLNIREFLVKHVKRQTNRRNKRTS